MAFLNIHIFLIVFVLFAIGNCQEEIDGEEVGDFTIDESKTTNDRQGNGYPFPPYENNIVIDDDFDQDNPYTLEKYELNEPLDDITEYD